MTLTPALTACAAYLMATRLGTLAAAAFVGGLLFGFSPFVLANAAGGHANLTSLFVLPLFVVGLDELFVTQRHAPWLVGVLLGLCAVVQFFLSTEILVVAVLSGFCGLVLLFAYGW